MHYSVFQWMLVCYQHCLVRVDHFILYVWEVLRVLHGTGIGVNWHIIFYSSLNVRWRYKSQQAREQQCFARDHLDREQGPCATASTVHTPVSYEQLPAMRCLVAHALACLHAASSHSSVEHSPTATFTECT